MASGKIRQLPPEIAILDEFDPDFPPHSATNAAILHACQQLRTEIRGAWLSTPDIRLEFVKEYAGIWVAPGSPYKNLEKTLGAIQYARENRVACRIDLLTCGVISQGRLGALRFQKARHHDEEDHYFPLAPENRVRRGFSLSDLCLVMFAQLSAPACWVGRGSTRSA